MTTEIKVTIKNVPSEALTFLWKEVQEFALSEFNEILEPCNDIVIDFETISQMESFHQIVAAAMTEHAMKTGLKISGKA